ncbi:MAG: restriction endonuclease subunit S [Ignavibacteriae bacterium]|nr:restriction endonuclease subunit S [Ignavibacteriota bacterium]
MELKILEQVCLFSKGKKPKKLSKEKSKDLCVPYINIKAFEKGIIDEYTDGEKCNLCNNGDLLMVWDGARAGLTGKAKKGAIGSTLMKIEPKEGLSKEYLFYFLKSLYEKINSNPRGVGIPHVEPSLLWSSKIVIPSISLQNKIVEKIEELFSELDNGIEELKKVKEQLKVYRQSVLSAAFSGKLTNTNLKNGELQKEMIEVKLGDHAFITKLAGFEFTKYVKYKEKGDIPVIRAQNVSKIGFIERNFIYVDRGIMEKLPRSRVYGGEILMVFVGAGLGNVGIVPFNKEYFLGPNVAKIVLRNEYYNKFILYYLSSIVGFGNVLKKSKATAQGSISMANIREVYVPFVSFEDQQKIVKEIEKRLSVCDKMEETIKTSLAQSESLRQSILKQAFEGKLIR